jgi:transcription initiation factor IIE alpha subunit
MEEEWQCPVCKEYMNGYQKSNHIAIEIRDLKKALKILQYLEDEELKESGLL